MLQAGNMPEGWGISACDFVLTYCKAMTKVGRSAIKMAIQGQRQLTCLAMLWTENALHQYNFKIWHQENTAAKVSTTQQAYQQRLSSPWWGKHLIANNTKNELGLFSGTVHTGFTAVTVLSPPGRVVMVLCLAACGQYKQTTGPPAKKKHFITCNSEGKWKTSILLAFMMQLLLPHSLHPSWERPARQHSSAASFQST